MIIFDLDETLADCEHRRHFVDPTKLPNYFLTGYDGKGEIIEQKGFYWNIDDRTQFIPDWKAFYEACDKDKPIKATIEILRALSYDDLYEKHIEIWSGRCESVRVKTEKWLWDNVIPYSDLKMRPIGNSTPDDELKERWLDELCEESKWGRKNPIEYVFDSNKKSILMWKRRGVFIFDVNQTEKEF